MLSRKRLQDLQRGVESRLPDSCATTGIDDDQSHAGLCVARHQRANVNLRVRVAARWQSARTDSSAYEHGRVAHARVKQAAMHVHLAHGPPMPDHGLAIVLQVLATMNMAKEGNVERPILHDEQGVR